MRAKQQPGRRGGEARGAEATEDEKWGARRTIGKAGDTIIVCTRTRRNWPNLPYRKPKECISHRDLEPKKGDFLFIPCTPPFPRRARHFSKRCRPSFFSGTTQCVCVCVCMYVFFLLLDPFCPRLAADRRRRRRLLRPRRQTHPTAPPSAMGESQGWGGGVTFRKCVCASPPLSILGRSFARST